MRVRKMPSAAPASLPWLRDGEHGRRASRRGRRPDRRTGRRRSGRRRRRSTPVRRRRRGRPTRRAPRCRSASPDELVGAGRLVGRRGLERLPPGVVEAEAGEAVELADRGGQRSAGRTLDDLADEEVAGVVVVVPLARLADGIAVVDGEAQLLVSRPAVTGVAGVDVVVRVAAGEVEQSGGVVEELPEGDAVEVVAVGGEEGGGLGREQRGDRLVEAQRALLDEPERGRGDERLGDARDAERRVGP